MYIYSPFIPLLGRQRYITGFFDINYIMLRYGLYNLWRDILDFIRCNKLKFIILLSFCIAGAVAGIFSARGIGDLQAYLNIKHYNLILVIDGRRGFWSYFFVKCSAVIFILLVMTLLSFRFFISLLNLIVLFIFFYVSARTVSIAVMLFGFSIIPVTALCLVPCLVLYLFGFMYIAAFYMQAGIECRYYRNSNYFECIFDNFKCVLIPSLYLLAVCFIESVLVFIFTLGMTV